MLLKLRKKKKNKMYREPTLQFSFPTNLKMISFSISNAPCKIFQNLSVKATSDACLE